MQLHSPLIFASRTTGDDLGGECLHTSISLAVPSIRLVPKKPIAAAFTGNVSANLTASNGLRGERTHVLLTRRVVDLVHRHQNPDALVMTANKACHQNNRGLPAFIERR